MKKEMRQMAARRGLAGLAAPIMAGAVLLCTAGTASAVTPHDVDFLNRLRGLGFTWPSPQEDADVVNVGHQVCIDRRNGFSPDALAQDIHSNLGPKGVNFADATAMINLSEEMFCPYH
jgi:hypothetical protein